MTTIDDHDHGFFGPGSITWRAGLHPCVFTGLGRAAIMQFLYPPLMAPVIQYDVVFADIIAGRGYNGNLTDRMNRTFYGTFAPIVADTSTALAAAERLRLVHQRLKGTDAITGTPYKASDVDSQVWAYATGIESFLVAQRAYGPLRLSRAEEDEFYRESVFYAELLGMPADAVPASRDEMGDYMADMRPRLCVSHATRMIMKFLQSPASIDRNLWKADPLYRLLTPAVFDILPADLRRLIGFSESRLGTGVRAAGYRQVFRAVDHPWIRPVTAKPGGPELVSIYKRAWRGRALAEKDPGLMRASMEFAEQAREEYRRTVLPTLPPMGRPREAAVFARRSA